MLRPMDEALAKIQAVSTGLTVHLEDYLMSGSTTKEPRSVQAAPSYPDPGRKARNDGNSDYESSLTTQDDTRQRFGLQEGNGSDDEEEHPNVP